MYRIRCFMGPDGDLAAGLGGEEKATYIKDIAQDYQNDDFTGIEDVGKLYKAYRDGREKSVVIPTKDSSAEDVRAFFQKIGMPETKEGYTLSDFDMDRDEIKGLKDNFLESAYKSGLTKYQAKTMWQHEAAAYSAIKQNMSDNVAKLEKSFDKRYDTMLSEEIPDQSKRAEAIRKERNLFDEFNSKFGTAEFFKSTGLNINPEFVHLISKTFAHEVNDGGSGSGKPVQTEQERLKALYPSMFKA